MYTLYAFGATVLVMGPEETWRGVVVELAGMPDLVDRLLAEHQDNGQGFCASLSCGRPGYGTPMRKFPCPTVQLATAAREYGARQG